MTPREKAKELIDKLMKFTDGENDGKKGFEYSYLKHRDNAKQCALIAVDYIIKEYSLFNRMSGIEFWTEVKQEINKL